MAKKKKIEKEEEDGNKYELIEEWCKKLGTPIKDGISEVQEIEKAMAKSYPDMSEEDIRLDAIGSWFAKKKRHLTDIGSEGVIFKITINTGAFDWVAKRRAIALGKAEDDLDDAIEKGYVRVEYNDLGEVTKTIPLYYWAKNRQDKPNKKWGDDLPLESYLWNMSAVGLLKSEYDKAVDDFNSALKMKNKSSPEYKKKLGSIGKLIRRTEINIPDRFCKPSSKDYKKVVHGEWIYTNCKIRSNDKKSRTLFLEANDESNFTNIFHDKLIDKVSTRSLPKIFESQLIDLKNLKSKFVKAVKADGWKQDHSRGSNKTFLSIVFVSATDPGSDDFSASLAISSPEMGILSADGKEIKPIKVWWKDTLPMDFGDGSKIALFYRMKQNQIKMGDNYSEEWGDITFDAQGYIMLLKQKRKIPEPKPEPKKTSKGSKRIPKKKEAEQEEELEDEELEELEDLETIEDEDDELEDLEDLEEEIEEELEEDLEEEEEIEEESDEDEFEEEDIALLEDFELEEEFEDD